MLLFIVQDASLDLKVQLEMLDFSKTNFISVIFNAWPLHKFFFFRLFSIVFFYFLELSQLAGSRTKLVVQSEGELGGHG